MVLTDLFWRFVGYSFLGWILESTLFSIDQRHLVNRGFLNGPICPIYGSGAVLLLLALNPLRSQWLLVFLAGILLTTILEYLTSWLMEKLFHARWWDYSDKRFNLNGRIALPNSLAWGVLCLLLIYGIDPLFSKLLIIIPDHLRVLFAAIVLMLIMADLAVTIAGTISLNRQLARLQEMIQLVRQKNSEFGENLQQRLVFLTKSFQEWRQQAKRINSVQRRLLQAFPNLKSLRYQDALQKLRHRIKKQRRHLVWPDADIMLLRSQLPSLRQKDPKSIHSDAPKAGKSKD